MKPNVSLVTAASKLSAAAAPSMSPAEFETLSKFLYAKAGICMRPVKIVLMQNRLRRRLQALGLSTFAAYERYLRTRPEELPHFIDALTTNETFFFREEKHWEFLRNVVVPDLARSRTGVGRGVSFWSAASSSGEELFTAAIVLRDSLPDAAAWKLRLVGTDISPEIVTKAREAVYGAYAVRNIDRRILERNFEEIKEGTGKTWRIREELRSFCSFRTHNLKEPFLMKGFDVIFCRNVFIYFDTEAKKRVMENLFSSCAKGGYIVFSHTESMIPLVPGLVQVKPSIYRRET